MKNTSESLELSDVDLLLARAFMLSIAENG